MTEEKQAYIAHTQIPESFAIGRDPFIPRDGLSFFKDSFGVSAEPSPRSETVVWGASRVEV